MKKAEFLVWFAASALLLSAGAESAWAGGGASSAAAKKAHTTSAAAAKKSSESISVSKKKSHAAAESHKSGSHHGTVARVSARGVKPHLAGTHVTPQSIKLTSAFLASAQLRPMAQQLASTRAAAAYAGVLNWGKTHPGEGAAAAYLALGHASMLDRKYADASTYFHQANASGDALDDYADYLSAQAAIQGGHPTDAYPLLERFNERHPDSIFVATVPVILANAHMAQGDAAGALRVLQPLDGTPEAQHLDFRYALGRAYQLSGDTTHAAQMFKGIYQGQPLSYEAAEAAGQLQAMGMPLSAAERKTHADQLFNAKRYADASLEYNAIGRNNPQLSEADRNDLTIYAAVCDFKLKHVGRHEIEKLPETNDDTAALKMFMLAELSRNEDDRSGHDATIAQMIAKYPTSRWLEEALYSGGNMYLLKRDAGQAIFHYTRLVTLFPNSTYAPSAHWRSAWLNYRTRNFPEAARLMDEQIVRYTAGIEVPDALYWRGRIYEDEEHNFGQAANYYRALATNYPDFYYGNLARQRLAVLGKDAIAAPATPLAALHKPNPPELTGELPENDVHLIRARLLANAALNEYIGPEIQASSSSSQWGALAQAEIYSSYGEYTRALQSMKHSGISFFTMPFDQVPQVYWKLLFPQPYWTELVANAGKNGLDPYLVASLIRQESEFNAGAVSRANAFGLMQLLPSVGKSVARKQGVRHFDTKQLLNPSTNLALGTQNLRQVLDRFGGQVEYALAAYNAGDGSVRQWLASNDYKDVPEFVESIPYTETREYVQSIMRNREMYHALYPTH